MAWLMLGMAGLLEVGFAVALSESDGFSKTVPTVIFLVCAAGSFALLSTAVKTLPIGTAYAVWTGIGAAGTVLVGVFFLGEPGSAVRLGLVALIIAAVVGLQVTGSHA